ncbi:MAG: hypothetical protein R2690_03460 [Acidimicrobiales bacterium]
MPVANAAFDAYREAYLRRDATTVLRDGDDLAVTLAEAPWSRFLVPAVIVLQGSTMGMRPDLVPPGEAIRYLSQGISLADHLIDEPDGDAAASGLDKALGPIDPFRMELMQLLLVVGRYDEAHALASTLQEPTHGAVARLAGLRTHAAVSAVRGEHELAHQVLNAAASLSERMRSRFARMLVDVDRSVLLGTQGRLGEGIALFDNLTRVLSRRSAGSSGAWADTVAAAGALTLSRFAAETGDPVTAERLIYPGAAAVSDTTDPYWKAQLDLSLSVLFWAQRRFDDAVELCREARAGFEGGAYLPGAAQAVMHEGRLAWSQGFTAVATPLLELARHQLVALGHHREPSQIAQALDHVA